MIKFNTYLKELRNPLEIKKFKSNVSGIKAVDNRDHSWRGSLSDFMRKYDFNPVGSGKYGSVFVNKKYKYAVKVFMRDTAYLKFLNFCFSNKNNKYLPKFKGKVVKINNLFMAVRMEKLVDDSNSQTSDLLNMCRDPEDFLDGYSNYRSISKDDKDAIAICEYFSKNRKLLDIHGGNLMNRPNGDPVIIDPFYNWFKPGQGGFVMDPDDISKFEGIF